MIALTADYFMTPEEYFEFEQNSDIRHEYIDGKIYAMAGATRAHNIISLNFALLLKERLRGSKCQAFMSEMKVNLSKNRRFFYPNLIVDCDEDNDLNSYFSNKPTIIIEVLSESTEKFDRGKKFQFYRTIDSLKEYILVSSQEYLVECFRRTENDLWILQTYQGLEAIASLECLEINAPLAEIYATIDFTLAENEQ